MQTYQVPPILEIELNPCEAWWQCYLCAVSFNESVCWTSGLHYTVAINTSFQRCFFWEGFWCWGWVQAKVLFFPNFPFRFLYMLRRVGDLLAVRARDKMAHSMGLLFITESIAKVWLQSVRIYRLTDDRYKKRHYIKHFHIPQRSESKGGSLGAREWCWWDVLGLLGFWFFLSCGKHDLKIDFDGISSSKDSPPTPWKKRIFINYFLLCFLSHA